MKEILKEIASSLKDGKPATPFKKINTCEGLAALLINDLSETLFRNRNKEYSLKILRDFAELYFVKYCPEKFIPEHPVLKELYVDYLVDSWYTGLSSLLNDSGKKA
ncbi:hypothetical protein HZA97_02045 [Candidatus Woesearchaeota archaeon]|nr:hypothetical protein [Candidatus Woesearchaeota archaeon]